jgi:ATP-binding cassette subfamily F protein 2
MIARGLTPKPAPEIKYNFRFKHCDPLPPPLIAFVDVQFGYSEDAILYSHVSLGVDQDSRVAIVGPNGAGKSTLLKLMLQEIRPLEGDIKRHTHLSFGRYHQHSMDILDGEKSAIEFMASYFPESKNQHPEWRQAIGRFGVQGRNQTEPIKTLSDGVKSRLIFAIMGYENPNCLLLDEPTNHLDMECIDALADAIKAFKGGVVLVSHDFRLIDQVAEEIWVVEDKKVTPWKKDIRLYKKKLMQSMNFDC